MANIFSDEIKIITGEDEARGGLDAAPVKAPIYGKRGIGYAPANGPGAGAATGLTGAVGSTTAPARTDGITSDGQNHTEDALGSGSTQGARFDLGDPGNGIHSTTAGTYTADEIMVDGLGPETTQYDSFSTLGLTQLDGGMLKQLNATDCATGKEIQLRTDGVFVPPDEVVGTDGEVIYAQWEDASTPPKIVGYVQGAYWQGSGGGNPQGAGPSSVATAMLQNLNGNPSGGDDAGTGVLNKLGAQGPTVYHPEYTFQNNGGPRTFTLVITRADCTSAPPQFAASCPGSAPRETHWPAEVERFVLSMEDGIFKENEYDSQVPTEFTMERSTINFCFGDDQTGQIRAGRNGGTILYETDGANGPIKSGTVVRVYDSDGRISAYTDSVGASTYIP